MINEKRVGNAIVPSLFQNLQTLEKLKSFKNTDKQINLILLQFLY